MWYAEDVNGDHRPKYHTIDYRDGINASIVERGSVYLGDATVSSIPNEKYTGQAIEPNPVVVANGSELVLGWDYTLDYKNNVNPGMATVTVKGINGYTGSQNVNFIIEDIQRNPTITVSNVSVAMGKTAKINAKATSGAGKLSYKSSNVNVARIDANGTITPVRSGKSTITVTCAANAKWKAVSKKVTVSVYKVAQPMNVTASTKSAKAKVVKKRAVSVSPIRVTGAQGTVTYHKLSGAGKLSINARTGKVTVRKGTRKGTYRAKIRVSAAGNTTYNAGSKDVNIVVKVK